MNVLNLVWPGFSAARRIARRPVRFMVTGLEACIEFPLDYAPWGFRLIAALVMFFWVFVCGIAALTWPVAMAVIGWAAHSGVMSFSHGVNWAVSVTVFAYFALLTSKVME